MLVYYFVPFIVSNRYLLFWVSNGHNSVTVQNQTHVYMNFFDHKDLGNHLLQLCPKVVKHPVYMSYHTTNLQMLHFIYYSTNIRTEYFKHAAHSPFFSLQNAVYFILLAFFGSCVIHILYTGCAKKKISSANGIINGAECGGGLVRGTFMAFVRGE